MIRIRNLDDKSLYLRQVKAGRHPVIKQCRIPQGSLLVVNVFFAECPSDALRDSALRLSLDVAGMERAAGVQRSRAAENLDLASVRVDFHVDASSGKGVAYRAGRIDRCAPDHGPAGAGQS